MVKISRTLSLIIIFLSLIKTTVAQNTLVVPVTLSRAEVPAKLDGVLDDEVWKNAVVMDDFMQGGPVPGSDASCKTEIRMLYDDRNLYVGITAFDTVGKYFVSGLQRDKYSRSEDGVSLMFDTYDDKIHSLLFYSNTMGARFDEEVVDNGTDFNSAYNTFWDVKTHIFEGGYTLEYEIPFSSLRFEAKEEVVMGFKVVRQIGRENEFDIYPKCKNNVGNIIWRVDTESEIILRNLSTSKPVYITPYVKTMFSEVYTLNHARTNYELTKEFMARNNFIKDEIADKVLSNMGVDAKIGLSKNFTLDATVNTDFAQAEADNRIFNYTRFNIFLPEKRQFFLEAKDYMNFSLPGGFQLFNSRNIGIENDKIIPIAGGLRLTGKSNGWQLGALNIQTQGLLEANVNAENFSVVHLHRDLFRNGSYCSGFFSNRITTNGGSINNQVVAFDFLHRLNDEWTYGLNIAGSKDKDIKMIFNDNLVYNVVAFRQVNYGYSNFLTITKAGKQFIPLSGFYIDNGFTMADAYNGYTFQINNNELLNYIDISTELWYKWHTKSTDGIESNYFNVITSLSFKNGMLLKDRVSIHYNDLLPSNWQFSEHLVIPADHYSLAGNEFTFESQKNTRILYQVSITTDKFYGGNRIAVEPQINGAVSQHFSLQLYYLFTQINFPNIFSDNGDRTFRSDLFTAKFTFSFTTETSFNALCQYDDVSKTLGVNFRFRYNPKEGTDLYVVYNANLNTQLARYNPGLPRVAEQALIVKFARTFSI